MYFVFIFTFSTFKLCHCSPILSGKHERNGKSHRSVIKKWFRATENLTAWNRVLLQQLRVTHSRTPLSFMDAIHSSRLCSQEPASGLYIAEKSIKNLHSEKRSTMSPSCLYHRPTQNIAGYYVSQSGVRTRSSSVDLFRRVRHCFCNRSRLVTTLPWETSYNAYKICVVFILSICARSLSKVNPLAFLLRAAQFATGLRAGWVGVCVPQCLNDSLQCDYGER